MLSSRRVASLFQSRNVRCAERATSGLLFAQLVEVVCHLAECRIPLLAEASCERTFEELVYWQLDFSSFLHGALPYVPAVLVDRHGVVGEALLADRVECARDGLDEAGLAGAICTL